VLAARSGLAIRMQFVEMTTKGKGSKWRIKGPTNARTYHVCVMCPMEKNTAEKSAVTREAKTWKSRVNATIWPVRSPFGSSRLEVLVISPTEDSSKQHSLRHGETSAGVL